MNKKIVDFNRWWEYDPKDLLDVVNRGKALRESKSIPYDLESYVKLSVILEEKFPGLLRENDMFGHTYFSTDDAKKIGHAFATSFKGIGTELKKVFPILKALFKTTKGAVTNIFVPVGESYWEDITKERDEAIKKLSDENKEALQQIQGDIMSNDLAIIAAMAHPGYFLAAKTFKYLQDKEEKTPQKNKKPTAIDKVASGVAGAAAGAAVANLPSIKDAAQKVLRGEAKAQELDMSKLSPEDRVKVEQIMNEMSKDAAWNSTVKKLKSSSIDLVKMHQKIAADARTDAKKIAEAKSINDLKKIAGVLSAGKIDEIQKKIASQKLSVDEEGMLKTIKETLLATLSRSLTSESIVMSNSEIRKAYDDALKEVEAQKKKASST